MSFKKAEANFTEIAGGIEVANSTTASAGAQNVCTLTGVTGTILYLSCLIVTADQVAAVASGALTLSGVVGGPLNYRFVETVSAGGWFQHSFRPPLPATADGVSITATLATIAGGSASAIVMTGWQGADP